MTILNITPFSISAFSQSKSILLSVQTISDMVTTMTFNWKTRLRKIFIWIITEILLNFLGIDHIADYEEYRLSIFEYHPIQQCLDKQKLIST